MNEEILKVSDVCRMLNCSKRTIYRRVKDGSLKPAFTLGRAFRFEKAEIDRFKREHQPTQEGGEKWLMKRK